MADSLLYISTEGQNAVTKIDNDGFLNLDNRSSSRLDLYMLAASIGIETMPAAMSKRISFIREGSVSQKNKALLTAFAAKKLVESDEPLEQITDLDYVFKCIETYANTGLQTLGSYATDKNSEILLKEWIMDLNQRYDEIFGEE